MPNRRRRKLSTAMSAVAALAVASPFALTAVMEMTAGLTATDKPVPEHHDFVQAAMITDLPGEIMSALQSSLSQFGVVVPNIPSSIGGSSSMPSSPALTSPGRQTTTPSSLTTPGGLQGLTAPGLTTPSVTTPGLSTPAATVPSVTATTPNLNDATLTNPGLTAPSLTAPGTPTIPSVPPASVTAPSLTTPGVTAPGLNLPAANLNPALTSPTGLTPGLTSTPGEVPISAPIGLDPSAGTYPILGDPTVGMSSAPANNGLLGELSNVVQQLGASQAIDLLKGVVVPSIMQAIHSAGAGAVPAAGS